VNLPPLAPLQQCGVSGANLEAGLVQVLVAKLALSSCGIAFRVEESALQLQTFAGNVLAMVQALLGC